jgi:hypothetical protein
VYGGSACVWKDSERDHHFAPALGPASSFRRAHAPGAGAEL